MSSKINAPLVTFTTWANEFGTTAPKPVSFDPAEVSDVEDYCGTIKPGSVVTLKNKKTYLIAGDHASIVHTINAAKRPA